MNYKNVPLNIFFVIVVVFLQVTAFKNVSFFGISFCMMYIAVILLLPIHFNRTWSLFIAFGVGIIVDAFYNTAGMHAAASVLIAYIRTPFINLIKPASDYEEYAEVSIPSLGLRWYLTYMLPLLFLHHFVAFNIEYYDWKYIGMAFLNALCSVPLTLIVILMVQYLFYPTASKY